MDRKQHCSRIDGDRFAAGFRKCHFPVRLQLYPIWSEELSRFLVVWSIFIGVAIGVRKNQHIGVDALIRFLPHKLKLASEVLLNLIGVVVIGILVFNSLEFIQHTREFEQLSPAMRIPMYIPYIAMPVGLSLSIIHFIHNIVKLFTIPDQAEQALYSSRDTSRTGQTSEVSRNEQYHCLCNPGGTSRHRDADCRGDGRHRHAGAPLFHAKFRCWSSSSRCSIRPTHSR